ncbi:MAG: hypothetical protein AAF999_04520 [Pseudomonadota bacterium]
MSSTAVFPVRHRRVFYVPGYDPFPPRRYRELYRKESAAQAKVSGYDIALKPGRTAGDGFGWHVAAMMDGHPVRTDIEVLVWSDIVRNSRPHAIFATYADLVRTVWIYLSTGAFFRMMRLRKGPVLAALYPVLALLLQAQLAVGLGWAMYRVVTAMGRELAPGGPAALVGALALACAALVGVFTLRWFRDNDGKFFAYYLMHDFAYSASARGAYPPALEARLTEFRRSVAAALDSDVDEVLVVGHSSGAHLAVSVLSDLAATVELSQKKPALALLSVGHVVPMVSFLPEAKGLRRDLLQVAQNPQIAWVDVTAPGDGCCFALCDPVAVTGLSLDPDHGPLVISAAFSKSLSPARWRALRWRFFRLHFQYLSAFDAPRDYDYFQITAGPKRLAERYQGRAPSPSCIRKPVNRYRSLS